jgi:hypothetical protein
VKGLYLFRLPGLLEQRVVVHFSLHDPVKERTDASLYRLGRDLFFLL